MNRNFRLTQSTDFMRVRRFGKSYAHPLFVLVALAAEGEKTRFGVTANKSIGKAVQRNRAKRLVREALRPLLPKVQQGWKVIIISRKPILDAEFTEIEKHLQKLFLKAKLITDGNE